MIGMRVRVNHRADTQTVTGGKAKVTVDLTDLRIDEGGCTGIGTAYEIGLAAPGCNLLEDHDRPPAVSGPHAAAYALALRNGTRREYNTVGGRSLCRYRAASLSSNRTGGPHVITYR